MFMSGKFRAPAALLLAFILIVSPFRALGAAEATPGDEPLNASELFTETEDGNISSSGPAMETEIQAIQPFAAVSQSITYNVYYYRPNGNYNDWLLSTWPDGDSASPMDRNYVSLDDFPGWAKYTYEVADDKINFIFHKNNTDPWEKDTEINRSIDASGQTEVNVFIISGDTTVYTSLYTYNLHYIRDDNAFTDWQANIWSANIGGKSYNFTSTAETNGQTGLVSFTTVDSEAIFFIHQAGNAGGTRDPAGNESITLSLTPDGVNGGSGDFYIESGSTAVYAVDPRSFNSFNVYYYRSGNYNGSNGGWNAWYWDYDANGDGADSAYFKDGVINSEGWSKITISSTAANLGLILKDGAIDGTKTIDGANRKLSLPSNQTSGDFYLVEGDNTVYSSKPSAVNRVVSAIAVTAQKVEAALNIDPSGLNASDFELFDVNADTKVAASVQIALYNNIGKKLVVFDTASNLDPDTRYEVRYTNPASIAPGIVTMRGILNSYTAPDYTKLGLSKSGMNWVFNLWAPSVKDVDIVIYDKPLADAYTSAGKLPEDYYTSNITGTPIEMSLDETANVWTASSADNLAGKYYMYRITHLDGSVTYAVDPYARATAPNGQLTYIVDMDSDPDVNPAASADASGFTVTNPTDAIIYELHVRDFSIHSSSGVSDTNKGLYKAFTETGTQTAGSKATGIDHLKELGVTYVQLQPVFDFGSVNELGDLSYNAPNAFNWGYDPQNYNVPEGSYSTDPSDPQARVDEFKGMINALHAAGIRVVMDVVFNHTYDVANGPFDKIVPSYFYRMKNDGVLTDGSGCGNEIATENAMVRKYIIDSIKYWETEYGIDGFRFDLMKLIDIDTMKAIRAAVKPATLIYGEPWGGFVDPFEITGTDKSNIAGTGIGAFNDDFRGAIKGKSDDNTKGFVTEKLDEEGAIFSGVYGSVNSFAGQSSESINYVTAHDNLNLWDKIRYSFGTSLSDIKSDPYVDLNGVTETDFFRQSGSGNAALQSSILSTGIIMLSEGIPFFQAGDEFLRSKKGDHNSYKSSDEINAIDWSLKDRYFSVFTYYKNLINLRKDHPAFRMNDRDDINSSIQVIKQDKNVVAYKLINNANGDDWNTIYVLFNGGTGEIDVDLGVSGLNAAANRVEVASDKSAVIEATAVGSAYRTYPRSLDVLYDSSTPQTMHHVLINPRTAERIDGDPATGPSVTGYNPLDNTPLELLAGETLPLSVNVVSALYKKIPIPSGSNIVWSSDTPAIATVNASGTVTGVSDGIAEITVSVTANNVTRSATVNIKVGTLKAEFLQPSINYKQLTVLSVHGSNRIANVTADLSAIGGSDREIFHYVPGKNELTVGLAGSDFGPLTSRTVNIPVTVTLTDNTSRNLTAALEIVPYQTSTFDWDEARIYFLLTDRFAGQDKQNIYTGQITPSDETYTSGTIGLNQYHGGDIAGLTAKIPYLKDLGVNTVWITPIVDNIEFDVGGAVKDSFGYAGYWAKTFEERLNSALEAQLGSKDDLSSLITALHSNGMKLMVDIVINHAGYGMDQVWEPNWDTDDNAALRPTIDQMGEFILPDGSSMFRSIAEDNADGDNRIKSRLVGLPDFKTENWYVRDMLAKWQTKWTTKYDIDYFRVDTVKHVDNDTWRALKNAVVSNNPDFKMIGELYAGSVDIKGAGNEDGGTSEDYLAIDQLDSLLDFDFKNIALGFVTWKSLKTIQVANGTEQIKIENSAGSKVNVSDIIDALKHREAFLEANPLLSMGQFLSSHDEDGFLTRFAPGTAAKDKHSEFMNAASLLVTSMGQPVIYYGEELGQFGKYSNNSASKFDDNRYDFNWTAQGENPMMLQHYKALLNSRADYSKAFSRGERLYNTDYGKYVKDGGSVLSFTAEYDNNTPDDTSDDEIVLVAINRSDVEQPINFDGTPFDAGSALKDMYGEKRASYGNYTAKGDLIVGADGNISEIIVPKKSDGGTVIYVLTDTLKIKEKEYIQVNKSADYSAWNVSRTGGAETEVTDAAWSIVAPASSGDYAWSLTPEADVDILRRIDTVTNTSVEAGKINKSTGLFTAGEIPGLELTITAQKGVQQAEFIITTVDLEIDGDKVLAVDDTGVHTYNKKIKTSQTILDSLMSKADASDLDSNGDTTEKLYIFKWEITDGDSMAEIDSETGELKLKAGASPGTVNIKVSIQTNVTSVSPNKPLVDYSDIYAEYTISVSPSQSENTDIKSVTVADIPATRVGDNQYKVTVPAGTSVSAGSFTVALKDTNATVGAVEYTAGDNGGTGVFKITAQNGHTATYAVNVTIAPQEGVKTTKLALAPDSGYTIDVVRGYPQRFVVTMTPEFESLTNSYLFWTLTLSGAETDIADVEWDPDGRAAVVTSNIISGSKNVTLRVRDSVSNKTAAIVLHIISASEVEEDTYKVLPAGVSINRDGDPVVGVSTFKAETIYPINTPEGFQAAPQFEWKTTLGGDEEAAKKVAELENADTEEVTVTSKLESGSKNLTLRLRELLTDKVVSIVIHILGGILNEDGAAKIPPTGIASIERNEDTQNGLQSYTAISSYPDLTPEGAKMAPSYTWSITISNALAPENIVTLENENADTVIVHSHITSGTKKATLRVTDSVSGKSKSTVITLTPAS